MKELEVYTKSEKETIKKLSELSRRGDLEAARKKTMLYLACHIRTLKEYQKHDANERVYPILLDDEDDIFPTNVSEKISELEEDIAYTHRCIRLEILGEEYLQEKEIEEMFAEN
jgi:hypothetical protein